MERRGEANAEAGEAGASAAGKAGSSDWMGRRGDEDIGRAAG